MNADSTGSGRPAASNDRVLASYAALAVRGSPARLVGPALRTKTGAARDILAYIASEGALSFAELASVLDGTGRPPSATLETRRRRRWLVALVRVLAAANLEAADQTRALAIFNAVFDRFGAFALDPDDQALYAQLLFISGDLSKCALVLPALRRMPSVVRHYLHTDLANPFVSGSRDDTGWLELINAPLTKQGLAPISLLDDSRPPFDRLDTAATAACGGSLVSVITSAYRPGDELETSVRSIIGQTWADLELIIVDDASGLAYQERFEACARLDPRVRVIHQPVNGGTYLARNAGLDAATGEFVTFQDSDDWSHPQRIERQLAPLLADPDCLATRSLAVRAHDDLTHQWLGYPAQRVNASSLLFRRKPVLARLGYFDSIRKGADAEYAFRLEAASGRAIEDMQQPLAYTRLRQSSLSRSEFTLGWSAPARIAHQGAYRHWHRDLADCGSSPYVPRRLERRPFPVPRPLLEAIPGIPSRPGHFDVIFLDDWQPHAGPHDGGLEEIATLREHGLTVGLAHREAIGRMTKTRQHLDWAVQEAVNAGLVDHVLLDDDVSTALLVVRDPTVLQFAPTAPAVLRADRVVVIAAWPVTEYPGLSNAYDPVACSANAEAVFRRVPQWLATNRRLLESSRAGRLVSQPVDIGRWNTHRSRHRHAYRPVIGRYDADNALTWPDDPNAIRNAYPESGLVDVRILGPVGTALRVLDRRIPPPSWLVYSRNQTSFRAFLFQLDFFVWFPSDALRFAAQDMLARAMASGAVVLAPERFRGQLGDSAVFCAPEDVTSTVLKYHADQALCRDQVERGFAFIGREHSADGYVKRIMELLES
jgi:O-antigen biosynthesis protein